MNLSKIKNDLQLVMQLVEDWSKNGVDAIERDIVLGKLRELYSDVRFGAEPQPETISTEEQHAPAEPQPTATEEPALKISEEMPIGVAISLDDVFEGFIPEDLIPTSVEMPIEEEVEEEPIQEDIPVIEESIPEDMQQPIEEPVEESVEDIVEPQEEIAEESAEKPAESQKEDHQPEIETEVVTEELTEPAEEEALNTDTLEEISEPEAVESEQETEPESTPQETTTATEPEPQPMVAEQAMGQPSLFGDDELFAPRPSRRTRMMSLYDDEPRNEVIISKKAVEHAPEPQKEEVKPAPAQHATPTKPENVSIKVLEEDEFTEVDITTLPIEEQPATIAGEQSKEEFITPIVEESHPEPVKEERVEPYIEPQIEVAVATPAASAVPESEQVLGEVIKSNVQTIADTIKPKDTAAEQIIKGSVNDICKAVGINDRFLLIRDLFGGSSEEYDRVMTQLNNFDNLEDCMIHIVENYDWNPNSDGAKLIMELIERKYS